MHMSVDDLRTEPLLVSSTDPLTRVVGFLKKMKSYEALVVSEGKVGLITTRDIITAIYAPNMKVKSLVKIVPRLSRKDTVAKAAKMMSQHRIRVLPVMERGEILGQVTAQTIIRQMHQAGAWKLKAKAVMTDRPVTVKAEDPIAKARSLMVKMQIDHLPVLENGKLVGMLTSSDIVSSLYPVKATEMGAWVMEKQKRLKMPVKELASSQMAVCGLDESLSSLMEKLLNQNFTYVMVTLWDEPQGIITYRDVVNLVAEPAATQDIPLYIIGLPEDPFEAEAAKTKFIRTVSLLSRSYPRIMEARSTIKTSASGENRQRRRYEVKVKIKTDKRAFAFTESGWELPQIFDLVSGRIKKLMGRKTVRRPSVRYDEKTGE